MIKVEKSYYLGNIKTWKNTFKITDGDILLYFCSSVALLL